MVLLQLGRRRDSAKPADPRVAGCGGGSGLSAHWLDRVGAAQLRSSRRYPRLFSGGWGDPDFLDRVGESIRHPRPLSEIELTWSSWRGEIGGLVARAGWFASPDPDLPPESRRAVLQLLSPSVAPSRVVILFAAHNDHGYETRMRLGRHLVEHDIASLILENPFYGRRQPLDTALRPVTTVAELLVMGRAAVTEGRALVAALRAQGVDEVGVSGFSMGGTIAALVSSLSSGPLATIPLAAAHSPAAAYTEGVLSNAVDWEALGGPDAPARLAEVLDWASVLRIAPPPHTSKALLAAPNGDAYVPAQAIEALHHHWPGSELRWLPGGHVSVGLRGARTQAAVIAEGLGRV